MAEIGLVASIVGVAGAGLQIAMSLRQLASEIREAAREVHDVATNVSLSSMTLKQVGNCVRDNASPHSESALDTLEEIIMNCRSTFNKIESMISQVRKDTHIKDYQQAMSLSRRVRWIFKKSEVYHPTSQLESSKLTLSIMLQVFSLRTVMEETDRSREGIEAARIEVEHLQAEIQSLVLSRVWVQRKEEIEMKDAILQEDTLPSFAEGGSPNERKTSGSSSSTDDETDPEVDNSRALILFNPNSLAALDASLSETDNNHYSISQNTICRSMNAINYLLDRWTISMSLDGRDLRDGNRSKSANRSRHPKSSSGNHTTEPLTRFTASKSASSSSDSYQPVQSSEPLPQPNGTKEPKVENQSEYPRTGDILHSLPFFPIRGDYNSNPIVSYKTKHPDLIWDITYDRYLEIFNGNRGGFCWSVSDGTNLMAFRWKGYRYSSPVLEVDKNQSRSPEGTYLHRHWFSGRALRHQNYHYTTLSFKTRLNFENLPVTSNQGREARLYTFCVPKLLSYSQVLKLRNLSLRERSYDTGYLTTDQHLDHLNHLRVLKFLSGDTNSQTGQVEKRFHQQSVDSDERVVDTAFRRGGSEDSEDLEDLDD